MKLFKINFRFYAAAAFIAAYNLFYSYVTLASEQPPPSVISAADLKQYHKHHDHNTRTNSEISSDLNFGSGINPKGNFYTTVTLGLLDKVSTQVVEKKLTVNKPVRFGPLLIEVKCCWFSESALYPETKVYLIISETANDLPISSIADVKIVFAGWMLTSAPSLSTFEHPVYDVWVMAVDPKTRLTSNPLTKYPHLQQKTVDSKSQQPLPAHNENLTSPNMNTHLWQQDSHLNQQQNNSEPDNRENPTAQNLDDMIKSFIQQ